MRDMSLRSGNRLAGVVRDGNGGPARNSEVLLVPEGGNHVTRAVTDVEGRFAFHDVSPGVYRIATDDAVMICRCWAPNTAPPAAAQELLLVSDGGVQRGQRPLAEALMSKPSLLILMIAAAIAIPIAVHNSQNDAS